MTHVLDLRSIFLARHAQHVVLIHFPIALFLMGVGFDLAARRRHGTHLLTAASLPHPEAAPVVHACGDVHASLTRLTRCPRTA